MKYGKFGTSSLTLRWIISEIALRVVLVAALIGVTFMDVTEQSIWYEDVTKYIYPYAVKQRVPEVMAAGIYAACFLIIVIPSWLALNRLKFWNAAIILDDMILMLFGISGALLLTFIVTETVKPYFGRLRPDFIYRCYRLHETRNPEEELLRRLGLIEVRPDLTVSSCFD